MDSSGHEPLQGNREVDHGLRSPLAFFMAYVPAEPSVVGRSMMTVALGWGTSAASYLYHTRANPDE